MKELPLLIDATCGDAAERGNIDYVVESESASGSTAYQASASSFAPWRRWASTSDHAMESKENAENGIGRSTRAASLAHRSQWCAPRYEPTRAAGSCGVIANQHDVSLSNKQAPHCSLVLTISRQPKGSRHT